eukprot:TRINITY_DN9512_c0_g1_i1.p1 TRINITY_DN9512_c0_g1~~TRINITY_DN9512_c0_g1_i1.p1  ORF type:complete len:873 (-),score=155.93 TRINITY_DN9512_c0_g1_i1:58-2676(-)
MGNTACCSCSGSEPLPTLNAGPAPAEEVDCRVVTSAARRASASVGSRAAQHPILTEIHDLCEFLALLKASQLKKLSPPWPRCQDLEDLNFRVPRADDVVVAISHGWPFQAHPDPSGSKSQLINAYLSQIREQLKPTGEVVAFLDFCCVSQRPFCEGQQERTEAQVQAFSRALEAMPKVYLLADVVLHIDSAWTPLKGDAEQVFVDASDLAGVKLVKLGPSIQIFCQDNSKLKLFDIIVSVDGELADHTLDVKDLQKKIDTAMTKGMACPVELRRHPMGKPNQIPTEDRGWVYLERFASMVKAAMVNESEFYQVCFSNSAKVLEEIRIGSCRLRAAALAGEIPLRNELDIFYKQLDSKRFSAASTDKATNTGGCSGVTAGSGALSEDREIVASIMHDMVKDLSVHWATQRRQQQQRQLTNAVNRQDASAVEGVLVEGADANALGPHGQTLLHAAAKLCALEVSKALLMYKADVSVQDERGNLPVHVLALYAKPDTIELFNLLAPTSEQLGTPNEVGMKAARRFEAWASVCNDGEPYQPALERARELRSLYPSAFLKREAPTSSQSLRSEDKTQRSVTRVSEHGMELEVDTWESGQFGQHELLNVVLTPTNAPWPLVEESLDQLIRDLCNRHPLKVFVLNEFSTPFHLESLVYELEPVCRIIRALISSSKLVLVECSGAMQPLVWLLGDQLLGAVFPTGAHFFQEDVLYSDNFDMLLQYSEKIKARCASRDVGCIREMIGQFVYGNLGAEHKSRLQSRLRDVLPELSEQSWHMFAYPFHQFSSGGRGGVLQDMVAASPPLPHLPALFILGDSASPFTAVDPTEHFQETRLPCGHINYIEDSKLWWFLESENQKRTAGDMLSSFLQMIIERGADN